MPSRVVDMTGPTMELVAEKHNAKVKPSIIMVDNVDALADSQLVFQDVFATDDSIKAATGADEPGALQPPVNRLRINVSIDACVSLRDELKDVEFLGKAQVARSEAGVGPALDAGCHVTLGYSLD